MLDELRKLQNKFSELKNDDLSTNYELLQIYREGMDLINKLSRSIKAGFQGLELHNMHVKKYNVLMKKAKELDPIGQNISTRSYKIGYLEGVASTHKVKDSTFTELKELMTSQIRSQKRALKLTGELDKFLEKNKSDSEIEEQTKIEELRQEIRKQKQIRADLKRKIRLQSHS